MSSSFITLKKSHPQFEDYLRGEFKPSCRAIPVKTFNVGTEQERTTFQVLSTKEVERPSLLYIWIKSIRLKWITLTFSPLLSALAWLTVQGAFVGESVALAFLSVFFFHSSVFMLNDYNDYIAGQDRLNVSGGSGVLQKGWMTARQMHLGGMVFFGLGVVTGLPLVLSQPQLLLLVALGAGLSILGYSYAGKGLKYWGLGDLVIFICLGPLLTIGLSRLMAHQDYKFMLLLGSFWGLLTLVYLQLRQIRSLIYDAQTQVNTLVSRLGFDRSVRFVMGLLVVSLIAYISFYWQTKGSYVFFLGFFIYLSHVVILIRQLKKLASPLSSHLSRARHLALGLHYVSGVLLTLSLFFL